MAVSNTVQAVFEPIGNNDRRLPVARWHGAVTVAGDATAGSAFLSIFLPAKGRSLFSAEDLWPTAVLSSEALRIQIRTRHRTTGGLNLEISGRMVPSAAVGGQVGYFLEGQRISFIFQPEGATDADVGVFWTNNVGETYALAAWGYQWDQESMKMPGGPVRPGEVALYSANALR